jgi:hypothetical protein
MATEDKTLDLRLEAARTAQERSRLAFFATTIIAFAMLTAAWNAYLSFNRTYARDNPDLVPGGDPAAANNRLGTRELQREILKQWVSSRMIDVSLLGIRVDVDDAPTVGAVAMFVALIWFYFSIRRENFVIGFLCYDYKGPEHSADVKWRIYHGINSFSVFTNVRHSDNPFETISKIPPNKQSRLLRPIPTTLLFLPIIAVASILILDVISLFMMSPFRPDEERPIFVLLKGHLYGELFGIVFWWIVAAALALPNVYLCYRINWFANSTERVLRQYLELIERESPVRDEPPDHVGEQPSPGSGTA